MGLDVYLRGAETEVPCRCRCGHEHTTKEEEVYFEGGITHNLSTMAREAGLYRCLWCPEELGKTRASQLCEPLSLGLKYLKGSQDWFEKFSPEGGAGSYQELVAFVSNYLEACLEHPDANVCVSR